jgi:hypothetical protein
VLIRLDRLLCAVAGRIEQIHRTLSLFSASVQHRQEAERLGRYQQMTRGMRLGCLFITTISLAAACAVFWIVLRD